MHKIVQECQFVSTLSTKLQFLTSKKQPFTLASVMKAGVSRQYLHQLCEQGVLERLSRGVYAPTALEPCEHFSLQVASLSNPKGVICLSSALAFHDLTSQMPKYVSMALPKGHRQVAPASGMVKYVDYPRAAFLYGVEKHKIGGVEVNVYTPAKTVADCFLHQDTVGLLVAMEAMKEAWQRKLFTSDELYAASCACGVQQLVTPYWQMLQV